jgi:hypothetical protein
MSPMKRLAKVKQVVAPLAVSPPAKVAGAKRAVKFAAFSVIGTVLANAAALAATGLVGIQAPTEIVTVVSLLSGSVAAGIHKAINWQAVGLDVPEPPSPTINYPTQ